MRRREPSGTGTCVFCGKRRSETGKPGARASACLCAECADRSRWMRADAWRARAEEILLRALRPRDPSAGRDGPPDANGPLGRCVWRGNSIWYRRDTSDLEVIREVLPRPWSEGEYRIPPTLEPRVILDVGGHIGTASVYFAARFPAARIYTFEPVPENFALLSRNIAPYPNIEALPIALGREDGVVAMYHPMDATNRGGFSFFAGRADRTRTLAVDMRRPRGLLAELGITRVDAVKIDAEGAEHDVLTGLGPALLVSIGWITGELHGERDAELLRYLSQWFHLSVAERPGLLSRFDARNKRLAPRRAVTERAGR